MGRRQRGTHSHGISRTHSHSSLGILSRRAFACPGISPQYSNSYFSLVCAAAALLTFLDDCTVPSGLLNRGGIARLCFLVCAAATLLACPDKCTVPSRIDIAMAAMPGFFLWYAQQLHCWHIGIRSASSGRLV